MRLEWHKQSRTQEQKAHLLMDDVQEEGESCSWTTQTSAQSPDETRVNISSFPSSFWHVTPIQAGMMSELCLLFQPGYLRSK